MAVKIHWQRKDPPYGYHMESSQRTIRSSSSITRQRTKESIFLRAFIIRRDACIHLRRRIFENGKQVTTRNWRSLQDTLRKAPLPFPRRGLTSGARPGGDKEVTEKGQFSQNHNSPTRDESGTLNGGIYSKEMWVKELPLSHETTAPPRTREKIKGK